MQGVASGNLAQPLTFTFQTTDAATAFARSLTPNSDGTFTLTDIPAGTYNLFIKGNKWLQKSISVDTTGGDAIDANATLIGGDTNYDNSISATDLGKVRYAYGTVPGMANWNPQADLTCDGQVSGPDLAIVRANYGKVGDDATPPVAPTGLSAAPGDGSITLNWDSSPSAISYNVYRSATSGSGYVKVNTAPITDAAYTDTGLTNGTTYYYVIKAAVSYSESAYSTEANATPRLAFPTDLAAYATGSGKVTLYWSGVPNATGYNIYRGTTAGGENYSSPVNGTTPVTTLDTNPGVTNLYQFSDTGLTDGTEYFYTVEAIYGTVQSGPSNEDSDAPDPTAIPWDSNDAATITSMIRQNESDNTGLDFSLNYCYLRVMGPDGAIYQEGINSVQSPDGKIDALNGTMTLGDRVQPAGQFLAEASSSGLNMPSPSITANALIFGGAIRRVTSTLRAPNGNQFTGTSGIYYLPSTADNSYMSIAANSPLIGREGPHAYIGMTADGVEADAGIMFVPANYPVGSGLPNRWEAFLRIYDGPVKKDKNGKNNYDPYQPVDSTNFLRVMGDQYSYIYADSIIGNDAEMKFTINRHDKTCGLIVFGLDYGGLYFTKWYVAASTNVKPFTHSLNHLQMKRELSIDQNINSGINYIPFSNAIKKNIVHPDGTQEKKTTFGYVATGSYMNNIYWQYGSLYEGTNILDWTSNLLSGNYYSQGNGHSYVTLSPPSGDPQNEVINIQNF